MRYYLSIILMFGFCSAASQDIRVWTSADGKHRIEAELLRVDDGSVALRNKEGRNISVRIDQLSVADREFLKSLQSPNLEADQKGTAEIDFSGDSSGFVLEISPDTANYLVPVIKQINRDHPGAPVVFVSHVRIERTGRVNIAEVKADDVQPGSPDGRDTRYSFIWKELPRKANSESVDFLIENLRTRPDQSLVYASNSGVFSDIHNGDHLGEAMIYLLNSKCDTIHVVSNFRDHIDEELAFEHGRRLGQEKVRVFAHPVSAEGNFLKSFVRKVADRTRGGEMPLISSVYTIESKPDGAKGMGIVAPAQPRANRIGDAFYDFEVPEGLTEIGRLEERFYDAVFYGPAAFAAIFLKNDQGQYIQSPLIFSYHSKISNGFTPDQTDQFRIRKFLSSAGRPSFGRDKIVWKMVLEGELNFEVHIYPENGGFTATYFADSSKDGLDDESYIFVAVPHLAIEKEDRYFGYDMPRGASLAQVREYAKSNIVELNLSRQDRDRYSRSWAELGFEPGINQRAFDASLDLFPNGIKEMKVSGTAFGERKLSFRPASGKIHLTGGTKSQNTEPWEGFSALLKRSMEAKFTKTEAMEFRVE